MSARRGYRHWRVACPRCGKDCAVSFDRRTGEAFTWKHRCKNELESEGRFDRWRVERGRIYAPDKRTGEPAGAGEGATEEGA